MNPRQKAILDSLPVKRHDPDGVTVKMVMNVTGLRYARASAIMREKIASGEAVKCWVLEDGRMVNAMKMKGKT